MNEKWIEYKEIALNKLENANYHLCVKYPEWLLPQDIAHAVNWAIEGWMKANNITPRWGSGRASLIFQLSEIDQKEISNKASSIITKATFLELELTDSDSLMYQNREKNWTIDLWKKKISKLIDEAEEFVKYLENLLKT